MWELCFMALCICLMLTVIASIITAVGRRTGIFSSFNILFGGVFLTILIGLIPISCINTADEGNGVLNAVEVFFVAIVNTMQVITINEDAGAMLAAIDTGSYIKDLFYTNIMSVLFFAAPVLTFGFIASIFLNLSAFWKMALNRNRDMYVFSEVNDKSLKLASDLRNRHKKELIVFTDARRMDDDEISEYSEELRKMRAVLIKKKILSVNFSRHSKDAAIVFFAIGNNDSEVVSDALGLSAAYGKRKNTSLYIFSSSCESEMVLAGISSDAMKVRRVNEIRSLINRILYESGSRIFLNARSESHEQSKKTNVNTVVIGMGGHGTEMVKALSWFGQMTCFHISITAFDKDEKAGDRFAFQCPELMSPEFNGVVIPEESEYDITINSGIEAGTQIFAEKLTSLKKASYVFISLGSDEENIRAAVNVRMIFERLGSKPIIQAVVKNGEAAEILRNAVNFRGQPYGIECVGDNISSYTEDVIINSELEADALSRHLKWGSEEDFWKFEYNYRSSIASAIHMKARAECGVLGADKPEDELTPEEHKIISVLEHCRWNAYMRSEGYVFSGSTDASSRNDLAKTHHDLVSFSAISLEEKQKDIKVGTR